MNSIQKLAVYGDFLDVFTDPFIEKIVKDVIVETPTIFFGASTSSSGKYHPIATNGTMGLVKHSMAVMLTAQDLLRNDTIMKIFELGNLSDVDKQIILAACLLHDNAKYGTGKISMEDKVLTKKTHPKLVSTIAEEAGLFDGEDPIVPYLLRILELIETHMGQWTMVDKGDTELDKPRTNQQAFVHLCDYIASRKTFDIVSELSLPKDINPDLLRLFEIQNR